MKRIHFYFVLGLIAFTAGWTIVGQSQNQPNTVQVYLFVVPTLFADGSSTESEISALKNFLIETVGGYTEMGTSQGGWKNEQGILETEVNSTYIVSSPTDIAQSLRDYISLHFAQQYPYILTWTATSPEAQFTSSVPFWANKK